jgi:hypothetical protein
MSHRVSRFIEHLPEPDEEDASPASGPVAKELGTETSGLHDGLGYTPSRSSTQNSVSSLIRRWGGSFRLWLKQSRDHN